MRRLAIYSNLHRICGNAAYGRDLEAEMAKYYTVSIVGDWEAIIKQQFDCVLMNWHPARVTVTADIIRKVQATKAKVILIWQNTIECTEAGEVLQVADAVVSHEPMTLPGVNLEFIPHGIPYFENLPTYNPDVIKIGTAGFPFPWKRFDVVAEAAKKFGVKCLMVAPESDQCYTRDFIEGVRGHLGGLAEIIHGWWSVEEVVNMLATCTVNIFWFESRSNEDLLGQSGSVRMGIASRRPIIISTHRKFKTLIPYQDEMYVAKEEPEVYEAVTAILSNPDKARKPNRIVEEMGWPKIGQHYQSLIERLLAV